MTSTTTTVCSTSTSTSNPVLREKNIAKERRAKQVGGLLLEEKMSFSSRKKSLYFRLGDVKDGQVCAPVIVRRVLEEAGWREAPNDKDWHLFWKSGRFTVGEYGRGRAFDQRLNHFAKSGQICTKDSLVRIMRRNKSTHGRVYDFIPETYMLPNEYNKFIKSYSEQRDDNTLWICKPTDLSRGQKIFIMKDIRELVYDCSSVIQKYIHNPLLVGGYKFDLRIYVLVTSCHPLNIYLFEDGLSRFGTVPYAQHTYSDVFAHLTNFSINKNSPTYEDCKEVIGPHNKWTLKRLMEYLQANNVPVDKILLKMKALIILSLINLPSIVPEKSSQTCFELFGFDIMLDSDYKPWLLEVNTSPALGTDCYEDQAVKEPLIRDLLSVIQFDQMKQEKASSVTVTSKSSTLKASRSRKRLHSKTSSGVGEGMGEFQPKRVGQYQQIFPFNQRTSELAGGLASSANANESVPVVKEVVAELRAWMKKEMKGLKSSSSS